MSSYKDRLEMVEDLGYGGDIHPTLAAYANQNIPKRTMIIKKDKETPVRIKVPEVQDITRSELPDERLDEYVREILSQPFYKTKQEIYEEINARSIRANIKSTESGKMDESKADRPTSLSKPIQGKLEKGIRPDNKKPPEPPPKRPIKI